MKKTVFFLIAILASYNMFGQEVTGQMEWSFKSFWRTVKSCI